MWLKGAQVCFVGDVPYEVAWRKEDFESCVQQQGGQTVKSETRCHLLVYGDDCGSAPARAREGSADVLIWNFATFRQKYRNYVADPARKPLFDFSIANDSYGSF